MKCGCYVISDDAVFLYCVVVVILFITHGLCILFYPFYALADDQLLFYPALLGNLFLYIWH